MAGITNTQLMKAIHEQDSKFTKTLNETNLNLIKAMNEIKSEMREIHAYRKIDFKRVNELDTDINGNGKKGIKSQNDTMWDEHLERKDIAKEVKIAIIMNVLTGLGLLANVFLG